MGFLPQEVKERLTRTIEGDPLPPATAVSGYGDAYFAEAGVEGRRSSVGRSMGDPMGDQLRRLVPNPVDREQFQVRCYTGLD
jgi:hypothetical protein